MWLKMASMQARWYKTFLNKNLKPEILDIFKYILSQNIWALPNQSIKKIYM